MLALLPLAMRVGVSIVVKSPRSMANHRQISFLQAPVFLVLADPPDSRLSSAYIDPPIIFRTDLGQRRHELDGCCHMFQFVKWDPALLSSPPFMDSTSSSWIPTSTPSSELLGPFPPLFTAWFQDAISLRVQEINDALKRLKCTSNLEDFRSTYVIIEAIAESEDVKKKLFVSLDKITKDSTILASNISSISITQLTSATNRPKQVIGMHFMNPPPIMKLAEM